VVPKSLHQRNGRKSSGASRRPPPFVGLTGGIAAGKSEVLAAFARLGAATLSSDALVHDLLEDAGVRSRLVERWGEEVATDGGVDRARVGAIVFERPEELRWLEEVLHPLVGERVASWRHELSPNVPIALVEVPLLFETGMESAFDATIAVVSDDETRAARAGTRGTDLLERRERRQLPQEEKAARADRVIRNDGSLEELEAEVERVMADLAGPGSGGA
jgi:dephospho-CoA kinase